MVKGFLSRLLGKKTPSEPHDKPAPQGGKPETSASEPAPRQRTGALGVAPREPGQRPDSDGPARKRRRRGGRGRGQGGERAAKAPT
ncbi:MAG: hypothetical protein VW450_06205, partial [Chloroflexota bacterium]